MNNPDSKKRTAPLFGVENPKKEQSITLYEPHVIVLVVEQKEYVNEQRKNTCIIMKKCFIY